MKIKKVKEDKSKLNAERRSKANLEKYHKFINKYNNLLKQVPIATPNITVDKSVENVETTKTKKEVKKKIKKEKRIRYFETSPNQKTSPSEEIIEKCLIKHNIQYKREYSFIDLLNPRTGVHLRFDFYLPELNICIEYDGQHHFTCKDTKASKKRLRKQKYRDGLKNKYCKDRGIKLIRFNSLHFYSLEFHLCKALGLNFETPILDKAA